MQQLAAVAALQQCWLDHHFRWQHTLREEKVRQGRSAQTQRSRRSGVVGVVSCQLTTVFNTQVATQPVPGSHRRYQAPPPNLCAHILALGHPVALPTTGDDMVTPACALVWPGIATCSLQGTENTCDGWRSHCMWSAVAL